MYLIFTDLAKDYASKFENLIRLQELEWCITENINEKELNIKPKIMRQMDEYCKYLTEKCLRVDLQPKHLEEMENFIRNVEIRQSMATPSLSQIKMFATLDVNFASWSLIGGWKPNSVVYVAKKACSSLKMFAGNAWYYTVLKAFNITKTSCPILPGKYVTSGMDLKDVEENHNFPKVYFYGKYKVSFKIKNDKNEIITCYICEMSLIRPWEKPI
ncbi:LOW QUALITY PROTEIN: uncharacterized protein LOC132919106 [Rhopalosiphum padi]|uniref:LOW QUALITY PROTEIN: uncharacterized protein LOC132919106 n=1 Tax=Rhopalosiphum padi TaxID=40932 RepID=UPI00298E94EA|nr:LOW QUALITY PROTEIN: uncharacterized protein LOC132919106 [Rhopalosiphum padi]